MSTSPLTSKLKGGAVVIGALKSLRTETKGRLKPVVNTRDNRPKPDPQENYIQVRRSWRNLNPPMRLLFFFSLSVIQDLFCSTLLQRE